MTFRIAPESHNPFGEVRGEARAESSGSAVDNLTARNLSVVGKAAPLPVDPERLLVPVSPPRRLSSRPDASPSSLSAVVRRRLRQIGAWLRAGTTTPMLSRLHPYSVGEADPHGPATCPTCGEFGGGIFIRFEGRVVCQRCAGDIR